MELAIERPHDRYGSAIFVRPGLSITSAALTDISNVEILTIRTPQYSVTFVYIPPDADFAFNEPVNFTYDQINLVTSDFNCHSEAWGYDQTNENGEQLESWADINDLQLIHDPKLPASFNSNRWRRGYNPDNIFMSRKMAAQCRKMVDNPISSTQHRPIVCIVTAVVKPEEVLFRKRFNFKRARWSDFQKQLDKQVQKILPRPEKYSEFIDLVKQISKKNIPRGCRTQYIQGLTGDVKPLLEKYQNLFDRDPFSVDTIEAGEKLMQALAEEQRSRWCTMIENLDMKQNSRRAWKLFKNLSRDPTKPRQNHTSKKEWEPPTRKDEQEDGFLNTPFTISELEIVIKSIKPNRAAGIDDLRAEQIKQFSPHTLKWILQMMNTCIEELKIPKLWRQARVVALLKPGKELTDPKSYRPVSLLCQFYKILERLIFNRIAESLDKKIIEEQAGFRPGKSCCGQILNLTQHRGWI
ncbi:rna-directed dna polymerase from mobile element jockey-like protein [Lasius niger]|uniref:Rna-directed dna polymerase from mobile element jockey-like protein n=1 Tax=Lasius niger TaxID=67767 RepID=A0A0J7KMH1_LASNI|nr:rna-directed dna polymerase from mobile element jockey-like protein [Lasius niger]